MTPMTRLAVFFLHLFRFLLRLIRNWGFPRHGLLIVFLLASPQMVTAEFHHPLATWWKRVIETQMMSEKLMMQSTHTKMRTPAVLHISLCKRRFALTRAPSNALIVPRVFGGHPKPSSRPYEVSRNSRESVVLKSGLFSLWPKFPFYPAELRHTIPMRRTSLDESSKTW